jgi:D-aspartate ligase
MMSNLTDAQKKPYALVLGLDSPQGLQTARLLKQRGVPVIGIGRNKNHFLSKTNTCERIFFTDTKSSELIDLLVKLGPGLPSRAVLYPCTDQIVMNLSSGRETLQPWYHIMLPPHEIVELLMDKNSFYAFAQQQGLPIPKTFFVRDRAEMEVAAAALTYPGVMKPDLKSTQWDQQVQAKVLQANNSEQLLGYYDRFGNLAGSFTVQEWIPGGIHELYACNLYFDRTGQVKAYFVSRKIRQWPPETGIGSLREEYPDENVSREAISLFERVGFTGLGYLEMKRDARTGSYFIVEPNIGRPTGGSAIAEMGGVELVYSMYCDAVDLPLPENRVQTGRGVKWIYLSYDLRSAYTSWRAGKLGLREWLASLRGRKAYTVFSWSDLKPFLYEMLGVLQGLLRMQALQMGPPALNVDRNGRSDPIANKFAERKSD